MAAGHASSVFDDFTTVSLPHLQWVIMVRHYACIRQYPNVAIRILMPPSESVWEDYTRSTVPSDTPAMYREFNCLCERDRKRPEILAHILAVRIPMISQAHRMIHIAWIPYPYFPWHLNPSINHDGFIISQKWTKYSKPRAYHKRYISLGALQS